MHWLLQSPDAEKADSFQHRSLITGTKFHGKGPNTVEDWWGLRSLHRQSKAAHLWRRRFNPAGPPQSQCRATGWSRGETRSQTQRPHTNAGRNLPSEGPGPLLRILEI